MLDAVVRSTKYIFADNSVADNDFGGGGKSRCE